MASRFSFWNSRAGKTDLAVSDAILGEMEDVLPRKFNFSAEDVAEARRRIGAMARTVQPTVTLDVVKEDPPNNRILECAIEAKSDYLVTGDKDLLRIVKFGDVSIVSVADFLEMFSRQQKGRDR